MSDREVSTVALTVVLAGFFVAGSAMLFVIWHTLSDFLAGRSVEGGQYLLALALGGVFVGMAWLLARYIQEVVGRPRDD